MEIVHQIERMNAYPPKFFWLSNILEKRPESIFIYKTLNSFFNLLDNPKIFYLFLIIFIFLKIRSAQKKS